jgi:hypothetical protein
MGVGAGWRLLAVACADGNVEGARAADDCCSGAQCRRRRTGSAPAPKPLHRSPRCCEGHLEAPLVDDRALADHHLLPPPAAAGAGPSSIGELGPLAPMAVAVGGGGWWWRYQAQCLLVTSWPEQLAGSLNATVGILMERTQHDGQSRCSGARAALV